MAEGHLNRNICKVFILLPLVICIQTRVAEMPQLNKFYPPPHLFLCSKKIVSSFLYEHFGE